jgi:hypothetical protein
MLKFFLFFRSKKITNTITVIFFPCTISLPHHKKITHSSQQHTRIMEVVAAPALAVIGAEMGSATTLLEQEKRTCDERTPENKRKEKGDLEREGQEKKRCTNDREGVPIPSEGSIKNKEDAPQCMPGSEAKMMDESKRREAGDVAQDNTKDPSPPATEDKMAAKEAPSGKGQVDKESTKDDSDGEAHHDCHTEENLHEVASASKTKKKRGRKKKPAGKPKGGREGDEQKKAPPKMKRPRKGTLAAEARLAKVSRVSDTTLRLGGVTYRIMERLKAALKSKCGTTIEVDVIDAVHDCLTVSRIEFKDKQAADRAFATVCHVLRR